LSNLKETKSKAKENNVFSLGKILTVISVLVLIGLVFFGGPVTGFYLFGLDEAQGGTTENGRPYKGNPDAKVVVVQYSDFQCPACGAAYEKTKNIVNEFQDKIKFEYKHFPLSYHVFAYKAAVAAEAAGDQGKFWEYHDLLYENREHLLKEDLIKYAEELNLDTEKFTATLESDEKNSLIDADYQQGVKDGVQGTPSFFVNGKKVPLSQLRQTIIDELAK